MCDINWNCMIPIGPLSVTKNQSWTPKWKNYKKTLMKANVVLVWCKTCSAYILFPDNTMSAWGSWYYLRAVCDHIYGMQVPPRDVFPCLSYLESTTFIARYLSHALCVSNKDYLLKHWWCGSNQYTLSQWINP